MSLALKVCLFLLLLCPGARAENWQELKGEHFEIFYIEDPAFAQETLTQAEKYYEKIASDLGYSRYDNFWQWDNRAKIYIYKNREDFLKATGKKPWIYGTAIYNERTIISYRWSQGFFDILLPHELGHLIFRDFVGFKGEVPLWLDEGIAQWEETNKRQRAIYMVRSLVAKKEFIPLTELMRFNSSSENDFALSAKLYAQAVTLVGYLIEKYGPTRFAQFCRSLRDGKSIDEALSFAYTDSIRNINELEKGWIKYYGGE
ncbi:MAG: peptidase MA family metallohydrolase [Candidatus Omnitrophica bacterium]|nr:peptidase MA family metallohydrolase [Candidatus Omnitrophota bacterium]